MISVAGPRHCFFRVDGNDGDDDDNRDDGRAEYEIISVADAWHVLFLEDCHDCDVDDHSGDDRGCIGNNKWHGSAALIMCSRWS